MKVAVCQSNYIPWRGYFDLIKSADLFVFHDDLQYTKQDWRNRNKIKTSIGTEWLTVPVKKAPVDTLIDDIEISGEEWKVDHARRIDQHLGDAPHFQDAFDLWCRFDSKLGEMNRRTIGRICDYLGIKTQLVHSKRLNLKGAKTDRLIDLMKKVDGKTYISGPAAKAYLDVEKMRKAGFEVEWMVYGPYKEYPQQYADFEPFVTVLDLIANVGPQAREYI